MHTFSLQVCLFSTCKLQPTGYRTVQGPRRMAERARSGSTAPRLLLRLMARVGVVEVGGAHRFGVEVVLGDLLRRQAGVNDATACPSAVIRPDEDLGGLDENHARHGEQQHA